MDLPLELNQMETMLLTDRIANADREDGREMAKPFLRKLASTYLELVGDSTTKVTATIRVTEDEVWLARSKFNSGDRCDADAKLGIHVLRKLYALILQFDAADATGDVPDAEDGDRAFKDAKQSHDWLPLEFGWGKAPVKDWEGTAP